MAGVIITKLYQETYYLGPYFPSRNKQVYASSVLLYNLLMCEFSKTKISWCSRTEIWWLGGVEIIITTQYLSSVKCIRSNKNWNDKNSQNWNNGNSYSVDYQKEVVILLTGSTNLSEKIKQTHVEIVEM